MLHQSLCMSVSDFEIEQPMQKDGIEKSLLLWSFENVFLFSYRITSFLFTTAVTRLQNADRIRRERIAKRAAKVGLTPDQYEDSKICNQNKEKNNIVQHYIIFSKSLSLETLETFCKKWSRCELGSSSTSCRSCQRGRRDGGGFLDVRLGLKPNNKLNLGSF